MYGAFIGAAITPDLAPFISGRTDDDPVGSKQVELFRLSSADNQQAVRFRFAHAGTDSWYFGIDDFGLYSVQTPSGQSVALAIERAGSDLLLSWPADAAGFTLRVPILSTIPPGRPSAESPIILSAFLSEQDKGTIDCANNCCAVPIPDLKR